MSNKTSFGGWLKQRRSELGVTQEELSNQLVFSSALLRKLESSERRPSGQVAALLAEYFHIPVDEQEAFITFARTGGMVSSTSYTATPGNATSLSPWRRLYRHQTNLPAILTPILGRQREKGDHLKPGEKPLSGLFTSNDKSKNESICGV